MDVHDELRARLRSASLVAMANLVSLAIMLVFVELIRSQLKPFTFRGFAAAPPDPILRYAFYGAAVAAVILVRILGPALRGRPSPDDPAGALARLHRTSLLTLALSEIPGVLGFVLFLLGGFNIDFYALAFVSLFLVFMYYPRRSVWEEWLRG